MTLRVGLGDERASKSIQEHPMVRRAEPCHNHGWMPWLILPVSQSNLEQKSQSVSQPVMAAGSFLELRESVQSLTNKARCY